MKETLAFRIVALYRDFLAYTTEELKAIGLNFGQMPLIVYTGKHPGCTQADLRKNLNLDWGYSQRSIARLVDTGFMTKERSEESACSRLDLTDRGREAFDLCHRVFESWDHIKMKDLSAEEKKTLPALLRKIPVQRKPVHL